MKLIIAYIRPERLNDVKQALFAKNIFSMTVTNVLGSGRQKGFHETYRGLPVEVNLLKKVRLEIGVNDEFEEAALDAISDGARTGAEGDGVIFVLDIARSLRVRTGETDIDAVAATRSSAENN
ncbi:P-II family nitrogen regulator [Desulfobaculum bizertense]|uniref:Nitrogen regulatory protein P-II family n=1 Tax=Desulfobaculum bizertense DSM 18034 TaxID=1121442 RepID=A0A1T4WSZ4_9BACT|nr:P-II family nitrogen regulator [Desulfobaculum bizertense]UIJ37221.1 P-II family nitrogen regulator [Desulfobaculum bizertense]SKA80483.1 nitrogen regulatory protein P-II family [Desulfobaculum bizertense DSM 18034]